jgi:sulfur transfer protein SufE
MTRQYNAVLLIGQDDQGPIDLSGAQNDDEAIEIGRKQALEWLRANGIESVTLQIVENGRGIRREISL